MAQPIIKRARVQLEGSQTSGQGPDVAIVRGAEPGSAHGQKAVRLLEESGRVQGIEFTCACGEVTAVELVYPGDNPAGA
jgi:hypothetical protein